MVETPLEKLSRVDSSKGPFVATVIIIVVLVIGAVVVFYGQYQKSRAWQAEFERSLPAADAMVSNGDEADLSVGTSTDLNAIEGDLEMTDFSNLETDIDSLPTNVE